MSESIEWSVKNGDLDEVISVVRKNKDIINKKLSNGRFPIHLAADYGQTAVIEYLLKEGADVNQNDKYGISPLLSAVYEGHTASVKLLLKNGANKNAKAPDGSSYIDCAEKEEIKALLK